MVLDDDKVNLACVIDVASYVHRLELCKAIRECDYATAWKLLPSNLKDFEETKLLLHMLCDTRELADHIKKDRIIMGARSILIYKILNATDIDVTQLDSMKRTSLMIACRTGDNLIVQQMAASSKYKPKTVNAVDMLGESALSYCCMFGDKSMLGCLFDMKVDTLNGLYNDGCGTIKSVLHCFQMNKSTSRPSMVRMLLEKTPQLASIRTPVGSHTPLYTYLSRFLVRFDLVSGEKTMYVADSVDLDVIREFLQDNYLMPCLCVIDSSLLYVVNLAIAQQTQYLRHVGVDSLSKSCDMLHHIFQLLNHLANIDEPRFHYVTKSF